MIILKLTLYFFSTTNHLFPCPTICLYQFAMHVLFDSHVQYNRAIFIVNSISSLDDVMVVARKLFVVCGENLQQITSRKRLEYPLNTL